MKEKKSSFRDKVVGNVHKQKESRKGVGYLNIPQGFSLMTLEDGLKTLRLDIIPYIVSDPHHLDRDDERDIATVGSEWYRKAIKVHNELGPSGNESIICPTTFGKKCPICEYRVKRIKEGAHKDEFKLLYPKERSLYNVIPIGSEKLDEKIYLWNMSDYLFQSALNDELLDNPDNGIFPDLDEGKTLVLKLKWKAIGDNSYPEVKDITFEDREAYDKGILDDVADLDTVLKVLSYNEIAALFFGEEDGGSLKEAGDDDDDDPKETRRSHKEEKEEPEESHSKYRRGGAAKEEEEKEEEKEPPTRSRRSAPAEEKEEPPVRNRRSAPVEEKEEEKEPPRRVSRGAAKEEPETKGDGKCPAGYKFGVDFEKYKACDTCKVYDDCFEASKK